MCFHTSQTKKVVELENRFKVTLHDDVLREAYDNNPFYHLNGFAHPDMLIIPQEEPSVLVPGKWGIVPQNKTQEQVDAYYKEAVKYGGGLNAQSEKLFDHFIYKHAAKSRRCLVPVTGFFEPHEHKSKKYPVYISRKDKEAFALAGIYTLIGGIPTFSILTKPASPLFEKIHNKKKRQPILISPNQEQAWLQDNLNDNQIQELINLQYPDKELNPYTVTKDLFSPKINSNTSGITVKFDYEGVDI
jgi:putative SOS response-associated peptidase YedK